VPELLRDGDFAAPLGDCDLPAGPAPDADALGDDVLGVALPEFFDLPLPLPFGVRDDPGIPAFAGVEPGVVGAEPADTGLGATAGAEAFAATGDGAADDGTQSDLCWM